MSGDHPQGFTGFPAQCNTEIPPAFVGRQMYLKIGIQHGLQAIMSDAGNARWNLTRRWGIGNANFLVGLHSRGGPDLLGSVSTLQSIVANRVTGNVRAV